MRACLLAGIATLWLLSNAKVGGAQSIDPCPGETDGATVRVDVARRMLHLCKNRRSQGNYQVGLGWRGIGKRKAGDNRTPLGRYCLGEPRASRSFGTFIPVGYPTEEQKRMGFSGTAVGIHGPPRSVVLGGLVSMLGDWTAGCIAVGTDDEIRDVAQWIREHRVKRVNIE